MTSSLGVPPMQQRHFSRPNSASSSSVVTIQDAPFTSSRHGIASQTSTAGLRPYSPGDHPFIPANISKRGISPDPNRVSPDQRRRSSAVYHRSDNKHGLNDGAANLNRWSQSTVSSNTSAGQKRRSSFSKRLSGSFGSLGNFGNPQVSVSSPARFHAQTRSPPKLSPPGQPLMSPPNYTVPVLPPIQALSSLSQAVDEAESPSTVAAMTPGALDMRTPFTDASHDPDYFGARWKSGSGSDSAAQTRRMSTVPSSKYNSTSPISPNWPNGLGVAAPAEVPYSPKAATRLKHERRQSQSTHHRRESNRSSQTATTGEESSASDHREYSSRTHRRRAPSQKALLSKALAKANHAVVLDGHQNIEGAIIAYGDACNLLRQVMVRSSGDEDRRKLEAVRNTYKNRIAELRSNDPNYQSSDSKALPGRPNNYGTEGLSIVSDDDGQETAADTSKRPVGHDSGYGSIQHSYLADVRPHIPPRRQSLQPFASRTEKREVVPTDHIYSQYKEPEQTDSKHLLHGSNNLPTPFYEDAMPPPLSPVRPLSLDQPGPDPYQSEELPSDLARKHEAEHTSWLNTIAESSGSDASSSVHSRRSSVGLRRKYLKGMRSSGQTEAEFDAALDAAVEAAYDDGFEPDDEDEGSDQILNDPESHFDEGPEPLSVARRNVELAKESVREAEREAAVSLAKERERQRLRRLASTRDSTEMESGNNEADEEERLLEEMTRDYIFDDAEDGQQKTALPQPRQSGSSSFSGRTWASSGGSNLTSAGTSLSTVAEAPVMLSMASQLGENPLPPPVHPPPSGALPPPPSQPSSSLLPKPNGATTSRPVSLVVRDSSPSVRDRRLSGMKAKALKIETSASKSTSGSDIEASEAQQIVLPAPPLTPRLPAEAPKSTLAPTDQQQHLKAAVGKDPLPNAVILPPGGGQIPINRKGTSPYQSFEADQSFSPISSLTKVTSADSEGSVPSAPGSPARFAAKAATGLRKTFSSSSLRNKSLNLASPDGPDASPNPSLSSLSSMPKQRRDYSPAMPVMPTPLETSFLPRSQPSGGIYLFDCDIHSPTSPGSPNPASSNPPQPLEPCPESTLLRPFWLLRSIYQTIAHPRGGYVTNRLFVPRDIWRVKNIKLKNVEDKVSSCDLLTAALLKLSKVNTLNADAVLEEMQFLEGVMDQVQTNLSKKLGSDVGAQGATSALRGMSVVDDSASNSEAAFSSKASTTSSKSYLSSWRKLRSKNSLGPSLTSTSNVSITRDGAGSKEPPNMKSLPMTTMPSPRFPKRDVTQVQCMGPNPSYMGALARLCDAAQILDQIARQVEDPGLKHTSQTHVGLELSARHAAEFFAFYICRFVFADIGLMLDKFIKRGSEWVLS